ncbi:hypothetical protein EJ04DRAFT_564732 [Polyplosphaeria fusca]|uniref:Uncharacterized protein n=1 Tax=Polyplosphaeria fusca TaxID=682080 RepID=A0A9P4QZE6_9PLEO|nr:hypothetical protein EJ04DRAFT_564732 [Polyplosphaeria fusca]
MKCENLYEIRPEIGGWEQGMAAWYGDAAQTGAPDSRAIFNMYTATEDFYYTGQGHTFGTDVEGGGSQLWANFNQPPQALWPPKGVFLGTAQRNVGAQKFTYNCFTEDSDTPFEYEDEKYLTCTSYVICVQKDALRTFAKGTEETTRSLEDRLPPPQAIYSRFSERYNDWHKWLFIRKHTAQKNDLWQYMDPATPAADLPMLMAQPEPQLADYHVAELKLYQWEYERWDRRDIKFERQKKALAEFDSEISKAIAAKHLYLIENKDTPHDRLTTLQKHLAPSDASRQRDLITRYKNLQTPPRGKKVEEWLRSWMEVMNMCIAAQVPETMGSRAQEDFLVACRTIDLEYGTSGLRALIDLEEAGSAIPSMEDYVSKFTTYLKRVRPIQSRLSSMAAELAMLGCR